MKNILVGLSLSVGILLSIGTTSADPAPRTVERVKFTPASLGTVPFEAFTFRKFGAIQREGALNNQEKNALITKIKSFDPSNALSFSSTGETDFTISVEPSISAKNGAFVSDVSKRMVACLKAMPESSATLLLLTISGMNRLSNEDIAEVRTDFLTAVDQGCKEVVNTLDDYDVFAQSFEKGINTLLTGEGILDVVHVYTATWDGLFGKTNAIFGQAVYAHIKEVLTKVTNSLAKKEFGDQLMNSSAYMTFVDFIVAAKTKGSVDQETLKALTLKCNDTLEDIFNKYDFSKCGKESLSLKVISIGENDGLLITNKGNGL